MSEWLGLSFWSFNPRPPLLAGETGTNGRAIMIWMFQSTPAITGGRDRVRLIGWLGGWCFNPRPPLLAGETPQYIVTAGASVFQSTPAITGGRDRRAGATCSPTSRFQSTPAITGGRDAATCSAVSCSAVVSIHARHYWRARPPPAGAALPGQRVSIHARHYWRARHVVAHGASISPRFNPRPPLLAGETSTRC